MDLDISSRRGTPIIAPADGKVISAGKDRYLGKFIKIAHSDNLTTTLWALVGAQGRERATGKKR